SGTARLLTTAGLIQRTTRRGDRREYFSVPAGGFEALFETAMAAYARFNRITAHGLSLMTDRPSAARERLQEVHDIYAFLEREFPALLERYHRGRAESGGSTLVAAGKVSP